MPHNRLLTGADDDAFCHRVSAALQLGYVLPGSVKGLHLVVGEIDEAPVARSHAVSTSVRSGTQAA